MRGCTASACAPLRSTLPSRPDPKFRRNYDVDKDAVCRDARAHTDTHTLCIHTHAHSVPTHMHTCNRARTTPKRATPNAEQVLAMFKQYDTDGNGTINLEEFEQMLVQVTPLACPHQHAPTPSTRACNAARLILHASDAHTSSRSAKRDSATASAVQRGAPAAVASERRMKRSARAGPLTHPLARSLTRSLAHPRT
jgi:hypothetical protein